MTEQEAIEILEVLKGTGAIKRTEIDAIDLIGEAMLELERYRELGASEELREVMEKQVLRKPQKVLLHHGVGYECEGCGNELSNGIGQYYCHWCGQRLDWE